MGAYSWSSGSISTAVWRGGAPGKDPVSGWPWPRLHQSGSLGWKPRRPASVVTKMTPVRGTERKPTIPGGGCDDEVRCDTRAA
jgi:hypothetical protein